MNLSKSLTSVRAFLMPTWGGLTAQVDGRGDLKKAAKNLSRFISPVQLARIRQDIQTWRDALAEGENAWYPHRVKIQRLYMDTVLNGQVFSCMQFRQNMTILKNYKIVKPDGSTNEVATKIIKTKWFREYMKYVLEAKAYGYSLIYLDDLINDSFPNLSEVRRFNVSPDRLNVTQFIYSISGAPFMDEPYKNWHIWVDTPTDVGITSCGYGYLYKAAFYEIIARNTVTNNADAVEMYGMPIRVGKTAKTAESEERAIFEQALANMGAAGWMLMDALGDEVELVESKSLGQGYKIYESLEKRMDQKISKIILGHADAMDSTPGKLGPGDSPDSPVQTALRNTNTTDMNDVADTTNDQLIPKLRVLGLDSIFPEGDMFTFDNNEELEEIREKEDEANLQTATIFQNIKLAGGDPDWNYFTERTGIPVTKTPLPVPVMPLGGNDKNPGEQKAAPSKPPVKKPGVDPKVKARLEFIYKQREHKHE